MLKNPNIRTKSKFLAALLLGVDTVVYASAPPTPLLAEGGDLI